MRIVTVFARHGTENYVDAEQKLEDIFTRQLPAVQRRTIIVDNALPPDFEERHEGATLLGADNSSWEFSAWTKGIEFLGDEIWSYDLVHLATSAFHTLYISYLYRFNERMLQSIVARPVCIGHIDCYNEPIRIASFQSQHWIRTSFLFIPPVELKMLKNLVSTAELPALFGAGPHEPFADKAPISLNYQRYILDWLTGSDIGQGSTWHSRLALNEKSWVMFRSKANAILNEHLMAIRLRAQGTRLIDTTWLSTQLGTLDADSVEWTRSWRDQLAERDADEVLVN